LWLDHLAHEGEANLAVLIDIVAQLPNDTLVLRERAASLANTLVKMVRPLASTEGQAFAPLLGSALNNLAIFLSALGRREEAMQHAQEAVETLSPYFLARPLAFGQWMVTMAQNYQRFVGELEREPDMSLLQPIIDVFQALQAASEEQPENGG
jgi:hypothetical protein